MLYGTECWETKCQQEHKLSIVEIRILCWVSGHTRRDKIMNEEKMGEIRMHLKTLRETIRNYLYLNGLSEDLVFGSRLDNIALFDPCSRSHLLLLGFDCCYSMNCPSEVALCLFL